MKIVWTILLFIIGWPVVTEAQGRRVVNFDEGWRFFLGDDGAASRAGFDDSKWRVLDLPHDWSIEGAFSEQNPTGQGEGGLPAGIGWYRKRFRVSAVGKDRVYVDFDGVYRDSEVWINGHYLGKRPNGYISFRYELTPWLLANGLNVLAVRVDNSAQPNSRWYSGSGIYRHVWLERTSRVAVDQWGAFVTTPEVSRRKAKLSVQMTIRNDGQPLSGVKIITRVQDPSGRLVAERTDSGISLKDSLTAVSQVFGIDRPHLWSVDDPFLYKLSISIYEPGGGGVSGDYESGGGVRGDSGCDVYVMPVGIRYFNFDKREGFFLNGVPLKIRGVCLHHDLGALGAAVNGSAIRRQLTILKAMGCNAIRTSHNPPAPELLELCDSMGMLVMDEAFDIWRKKKTKYDYAMDFPAWHARDLADQVLRDRNHPSIIMWSIGNEIREQFDSSGIRMTRELVSIVKKLDPTRPVLAALTEPDTNRNFIYRSGALDLVGLNYHQGLYDSVTKLFPGYPFVATETTSALETRGHYDMPADSIRRWPPGPKQPLKGGNPDWTVSAYDNVSAYWGSTHEETWKAVKRNPAVSGLFVWTGWDYLGEPAPYPWPARSSYFGIVDLAGFPKDIYYMYQSEWTRRRVLHLFPHWNWHYGDSVDVWAYYNRADSVELFLNGRALGIRHKTGDALHVSWRVAWRPGILKAVSMENGKIVVEDSVCTAGPAAKIELRADRKIIHADCSDLCFIRVSITDARGRPVPDAATDLRCDVSGAGSLAGMDNGYQADLESFRGSHHKAYNGLCLVIVRAAKKPGRIQVRVSAERLIPAVLSLRVDPGQTIHGNPGK